MIISQRRIRNVENHLSGIDEGSNFYIGLTNLDNYIDRLNQIGFGQEVGLGQQILPDIIGPISRFNANGKYRLLRELPKETCFRESYITDWHGNHHTVYIEYQRYQREMIEAPSIELTIASDANNKSILLSPLLINKPENYQTIKHVINLFLEIFGECETLYEDLISAFNIPVLKLNWNVLPQGNQTWKNIEPALDEIINRATTRKRVIVKNRITKISEFDLNFVAIGNAGFKGYIVFGFKNKNFFVLESIYSGNATYVLDQDWEELSQLSKGQILSQNLHEKRIIHSPNWINEVDNLLN